MARKSNTLEIGLIDDSPHGIVDVIVGYVSPKKDHIKWSIDDFKDDGLLVTFALFLDAAHSVPANLLLDQDANITNTVKVSDPPQAISRLNPDYDTSQTPVYLDVTVSSLKDGLDHHIEVRKKNLETLKQKLREMGGRLRRFDDPSDPQIIIQP